MADIDVLRSELLTFKKSELIKVADELGLYYKKRDSKEKLVEIVSKGLKRVDVNRLYKESESDEDTEEEGPDYDQLAEESDEEPPSPRKPVRQPMSKVKIREDEVQEDIDDEPTSPPKLVRQQGYVKTGDLLSQIGNLTLEQKKALKMFLD